MDDDNDNNAGMLGNAQDNLATRRGKTRTINTQKGNHRTRHSWAGEAETQGQQVKTIR